MWYSKITSSSDVYKRQLFIIAVNFRQIPSVFARIFEEAFGLRQMAAGGFGAVLMNGVKPVSYTHLVVSSNAYFFAAAFGVRPTLESISV